MAEWHYRVDVVNPGRLPITNVRTEVHFPGPVERSHHDGSKDVASEVLSFYVPVIAPGGMKTWNRTFWMDGAAGANIKETFAVVEFSTADAGDRKLRWPPKS
ncbi:hypothetical protein [Nakamurella deserti]|uniref:hypothetical protein n=1 Tax=Nakamurella deserti TaxID=2164074 RepID=UPI00130085E3|nr:hypothetical protein [Nakamurella deserti]